MIMKRGGGGLLHVGDGDYGGCLREGFGLVLGADAVDVAATALGEALRRLHAALGNGDAQGGAVELEVARAVHAHEEGLVLGSDLVPVVGDVLEGESAAVGQAPGAGARGGQDALDVERILAAPRTGSWRLSDGGALTFEHVTNDWHEITTEDEAFFMRVYGPGDFKFHGADLGILVTKGRMQTTEGLTERCRRYIDGIRAQYKSEPLPQAPPVIPIAYVKLTPPASFHDHGQFGANSAQIWP